jgi:putative acyl-CoA dehydrogenase
MATRFDSTSANQSPPCGVDLSPATAAGGRGGGERRRRRVGARLRTPLGRGNVRPRARGERKPPKLRIFDAKGFAATWSNSIRYHQLMADSIAAGLAASTWRDDAAPAPAPAQVTRAARFYMAAQVETGHLCPITMTRAAVAALATEPALAAKVMPKIMSREYDPHFRPWWEKRGMTLGMGMTERQGGTDVHQHDARRAGRRRLCDHRQNGHVGPCATPLKLAQAPGGLSCS